MIITDLGVYHCRFDWRGLTLDRSLQPDVTLDHIKSNTQASFKVANTLTRTSPATQADALAQ